jgi:hypothetical protein
MPQANEYVTDRFIIKYEWEDDIKKNLRDIQYENVNWLNLLKIATSDRV